MQGTGGRHRDVLDAFRSICPQQRKARAICLQACTERWCRSYVAPGKYYAGFWGEEVEGGGTCNRAPSAETAPLCRRGVRSGLGQKADADRQHLFAYLQYVVKAFEKLE